MIQSYGPILGLFLAFLLIWRKVPPFAALIIGAAVGGIVGGGSIVRTGTAMLQGGAGMVSSAVCILASGLLAGALQKTGAAERITRSVLAFLGERWALCAVAASVMLLTAVGVFVDIAVITAAPIALTIGQKTGRSSSAVLLAMIGGGKAGNIISPNPNTIAAARAFSLDLTAVMTANLLPALCAFGITVLLASCIRQEKTEASAASDDTTLPSLTASLAGPAAVLLLLALRPAIGLAIDPMFVLPIGALLCILACGKKNSLFSIARFGLHEVFPVALLLLGTGTLAGVIHQSNLQLDLISGLEAMRIPTYLLAPLSGILMGGAAASTTAGTAIASQSFGSVLLSAGVPARNAAAMIHAGATVLDSLPHGSFFHSTAGCVGLDTKSRLKLIPAEAAIGLTSTAIAVLLYR